MHPDMPILKAEALCFSHSPPPAPLLFDRLSMILLPGVTFVSGDESSGKTTLLRLLAGALPATGPAADLQVKGIRLAENRPAYLQQVVWLDPRDTALDPQTARQIFNDFSARHTGFDAGALQAHIDGLS
ncbi:MAG: ABC transporter, partial [Polaromonas sp.]